MDWQKFRRGFPERITSDVIAQLIVMGGIVMISWILGAVGGLPIWAYVPLAIFVIGATLWVINQLRILRQKPSVDEARKDKTNPGIERLILIAQDDDVNINQRINLDLHNIIKVVPQLQAADPYIDLLFFLINTSVFDITIHGTTGRIDYEGQPLQSPPLMLKEKNLIRHAQRGGIRLRQHVLPHVAEHMKEKIAQSNPIALDTGHIALKFYYNDLDGNRKDVGFSLPGNLFQIK